MQTGQVTPRMDTDPRTNNTRRRLHTKLDIFANSLLLCAMFFWPINIFLKWTGDLCHSTMSKVVFYSLPTLALFFLWMAMFQERGCYAIKREGKTAMQYKRIVSNRLCLMLLLIIVSVLALWQASLFLCRDGCALGPGDGEACVKGAPRNASLDASSTLSSNASSNPWSDPSSDIVAHAWKNISSWI